MQIVVTLLESIVMAVDYPKAIGALSTTTVTVTAGALGVTIGPVQDYMFTDNNTNATYLGYNYAIALSSSNMSAGTTLNVSQKVGALETPAASTFDTTQAIAPTATSQANLTAVTAVPTNILTGLSRNQKHCGVTYAGTQINCTGAITHPEFDRAQFVKIATNGLPGSITRAVTQLTASVTGP